MYSANHHINNYLGELGEIVINLNFLKSSAVCGKALVKWTRVSFRILEAHHVETHA
jgi:hypothetical protein